MAGGIVVFSKAGAFLKAGGGAVKAGAGALEAWVSWGRLAPLVPWYPLHAPPALTPLPSLKCPHSPGFTSEAGLLGLGGGAALLASGDKKDVELQQQGAAGQQEQQQAQQQQQAAAYRLPSKAMPPPK